MGAHAPLRQARRRCSTPAPGGRMPMWLAFRPTTASFLANPPSGVARTTRFVGSMAFLPATAARGPRSESSLVVAPAWLAHRGRRSGRLISRMAAPSPRDVSGAAEDRQVRVARERRVGSGELAQDEDGTARAHDPTSVSAVAAESRVRSYQCQPAIPSSAAVFSASSSPLA